MVVVVVRTVCTQGLHRTALPCSRLRFLRRHRCCRCRRSAPGNRGTCSARHCFLTFSLLSHERYRIGADVFLSRGEDGLSQAQITGATGATGATYVRSRRSLALFPSLCFHRAGDTRVLEVGLRAVGRAKLVDGVIAIGSGVFDGPAISASCVCRRFLST